MTPFTRHLSTFLYALLIGIVAFCLIVIATAFVVTLGDWLSPGIFGTVHVNRTAIDLQTPGVAPAMLALLLLLAGLVLAALLPLIGMLRSTAAGAPFTAANVRRLYVIAGALATGLVIQVVLPPVLPVALASSVRPFGGGGVFALLLTVVLAEVFREGVRLREDVEGTI